jgi:two-component system chemotaxis response regulator CheB
VKAEHVVPIAEMGRVLAELTRECVDDVNGAAMPASVEMEADIAEHGVEDGELTVTAIGTSSGFTCPDCDGPLFVLPGMQRYRCRVGHGWSVEALLAEKDTQLERALWMAMRTLDEKISLNRRMRANAVERGSHGLAERYAAAENEAEQAVGVLRDFLTAGTVSGPGT